MIEIAQPTYDPYYCWVSRSKVKVTGALNVRMVSAYYLEYILSQSLHISNTD
jgi:hypothetical protein